MPDDNFEMVVGLPEDTEPLTDQETVLVDKYGNEMFDEADELSDDVKVQAESAISPATLSYLTYGAYNADFRLAPAIDDRPLDQANTLPYWRLVNVQGGITAEWVETASSWSGYGVKFTMDNPANSDEAYMEQIIPVDASDLWGHFRAIVLPPDLVSGGTPDYDPFIEVEYYDASGSAVGGGTRLAVGGAAPAGADFTAGTFAIGYDEASDSIYVQTIPADAKFAALRFGVAVGASGGVEGVASTTFTEVYAKQPTTITSQYMVVNDNFSAGTTGANLFVGADGDWTTLATGAARYVTPWAGFGVGVSVRHNGGRTGGFFSLYGHNAEQNAAFGGTVVLNATYPNNRANTLALGDHITTDFVAGDNLIAKADTTAGWSGAAPDEALGAVLLVQFELLNNSS